MSKGFTLVETLIVLAIIGILAAIVVPQFQSNTTEAKEAAARDNLRILRSAIEIYASQHKDVAPGYPNNNSSGTPQHIYFLLQLKGTYLNALPKNPFNGKLTVKMIKNTETFPNQPVESFLYGWIYQPATKTIRLNWEGKDSAGINFFDY